jgi:hypothetical protein
MIQNNSRQERGLVIAQNYEISKLSENVWLVPSQSGNGSYEVTKFGNDTYACT